MVGATYVNQVYDSWYMALGMIGCVVALVMFVWPDCYHRMNPTSRTIRAINADTAPTLLSDIQ
jgi:hypothetical protein